MQYQKSPFLKRRQPRSVLKRKPVNATSLKMSKRQSPFYNINSIIQQFNIKQIYVSYSLQHFKNRVKKKFNLKDYTNKQKPCIFFGVYDKNDINNIRNHQTISYVMPGGSDLPNCKHVVNENVRFISISRNIQARFQAVGENSTLVNFNLVDRNLFKPVSKTDSKIFIYDGFIKKPQNAKIYGKQYHDQVRKKLPQYQYIFSSDLNLPYEKMPDIYAQCFIGLRLTANDGNANMVQEMEAMGIPVVHNFSNYGLKWKNVDDIIKHILDKASKQKLQERKERERLEKERLEREKVERSKKEKVRLEKERLEKIRLEKIRLEKIRLEKERLEKIRLEKIRLEKERVESEQKNRKFNILIRNTYRPNMFKECIESVQEQTHIIPILGNNVRIICCYDDKRSSKYLNKYKNMFKNIDLLEIVPNKSNTLQEYNLYCNNLMDKVKDGWILFLNDDNKFLNKHTLSNISKNIDNEDDIIFWSIPLGDAKKNNVYAKMLKNIDMNTGKQMTCDAWKTGFCVHSKHIRKARATAGHDGLDNFLANLLKKNKFNKKFLDQIVVHPVYNKRLFGLREEDYDLHALIRERGIKQCYMSEKIAHLKPIIQTNYKITDYDNRDSPCIFFGLYNDNDISIIIRNHIHGEKYIVPMGIRYLYDDTKSENGWDENHNSDFDNYKKTLTVNPLFLSISDKMTDLFKHNKEYSTRIHFDCVDKMLFKPTSGLGPISQIRHKKILINCHSYLNDNAGDTIMVSNYMNLLMRDNNHITLITKYKCPDFIRNLIYKKYTIVITGDDTKNIMNDIDRYMYRVDYALIRNHEVLEEMKSKPYLNRVIFYGLDCHMDGLKKMNNKFHYIITQSELLKKKLVKNNIDSEKIYIVQPIVFKYDFNLPKKNDNEIRLVYCGTLRDEENILEIIEEFQKIHKKRPEVVLKIVYGKIHGDVTFTRKVNEYIKNGVKGITFKHNLSHKDACYEIATSDIGICWRKNGWGDNGEISTKMKEYKMYDLKILNKSISLTTLQKNVSIICCTNRPSFHWNILQNVNNLSEDNYNIKLLICLNSDFLDIKYYKKFFDDNNIDNEIIKLDKSLGECLNYLILKSSTRFIIKIDDDDIYLPGLINNCIPHLHDNSVISLSKKYVYCPENNKLFIRENNIGYGSLLGFDKYKIKNFKSISIGEDTHFLKDNQVKLLNLLKYHVHIRHLNEKFHTDNTKNYFNDMSEIYIDNYIKNILNDYGLYDIKITAEKNDIVIKKCLDSYSKPNLNLNYNDNKLNVIGIFDEFLYNTYKNIFNIQLLNKNQVINKKYDFFFCESCWNGNNGEWKYKIYSKQIKKEVHNIIKQCKKLKIPTIFYNKEDPVSFDNFIETAKHFDIIITTDINCVEKYKKITKSKIFAMPFTINPLTINNIGRKNDDNKSFFAGSYTYSLSDVRKHNTGILLDKLKTKNFSLFDRSLNKKQRKEFYNNKYSLNMFHSKYNKCIHSAISHDKLLNIHLTQNWCGNLNTVKTSDTMFARRVLEASIMKNSLVTDYSQGVYKNFKNSIYKLEEELKYETNEDILLNQIKKQIGWRTVIEKYNSYIHFYNLLKKINIKFFEKSFINKKKISVICSTNRINNY